MLPAPAYGPPAGVCLWRANVAGSTVQEVFERPSGTFGYRYLAWTAQRDAGGNVRAHGWRRITGIDGSVADSADAARKLAESDAERRGLEFPSNWSADV